MGGGAWTAKAFTNYSVSSGRDVVETNGIFHLADGYSAQDLYKSKRIQKELDPCGVIRECCDSEEHPNTIPVILALDVTGSMGSAAVAVAQKLNEVMTKLYEQVQDVEFLVMGIGDLAYDDAPIQASQFESDIRIAEQLDKIYFEGGGGGNSYESYTGAWYFGARHTRLDCWNRGKKGIIITMGDEPLNPYLPKDRLAQVCGDNLQGDVETKDIYDEASEKYDIYHLAVNDRATSYKWHKDDIHSSYPKYLDESHFKVVSLDNIAQTIVDIVTASSQNATAATSATGEISW